MMKKTLFIIPLLLFSSCSNNEIPTNWKDADIKSMNEAFLMPEGGDSSLYTIPFMYIDGTYSLLVIKEVHSVNYIVNNGTEEDITKYSDVAIKDGFEKTSDSDLFIKEVPTGKIELTITYGPNTFTSGDAFVATGVFKQKQTDWKEDELKLFNETFLMPEDGDPTLYSIPFMYIDDNYILGTLEHLNIVEYVVFNSCEEDVNRYYQFAKTKGFTPYEELPDEFLLYKEVPTGVIEILIGYGVTTYSPDEAFMASARFTAN